MLSPKGIWSSFYTYGWEEIPGLGSTQCLAPGLEWVSVPSCPRVSWGPVSYSCTWVSASAMSCWTPQGTVSACHLGPSFWGLLWASVGPIS